MIPRQSDGSINFDRVFQLYRGSEARPVHNQKQYDAAVEEGFGDYLAQEYPRILYNAAGETKRVENAEEEKAASGYGRKGVIAPKPKTPETAGSAFVPHNNMPGAIEALERRTNEQAEKIANLELRLAQLEDPLSSRPTDKKGR